MPVETLFPTFIHRAPLGGRESTRLNRELVKEARQIQEFDDAGRRWSAKNYPGGFTTYSSLSRLHQFSSTFAELEKRIGRHVRAFAGRLELDLTDRPLVMTDCWLNIMPRGVTHSLHLHPLATISGTYYVRTPRGCSALKFEDPRLSRMMAAPPRRGDCRRENRQFVSFPAAAGHVILFESWLRHEVAANPSATERISISFNYNWF